MLDYDSQLLVSVGKGDMVAFRDLFDRNYTRAVNVAYRFLGDRDSAEDIAMDAFVSIQKASPSYKPKAKFTTYLYRVVGNLCINHSKRKRWLQSDVIDELFESKDPSSDPVRSFEAAQLSETVRNAMLALPPNQRMALILTKYEDLSYDATAQAMEISNGAVESLLHRAKQNLKKALSEYMLELS